MFLKIKFLNKKHKIMKKKFKKIDEKQYKELFNLCKKNNKNFLKPLRIFLYILLGVFIVLFIVFFEENKVLWATYAIVIFLAIIVESQLTSFVSRLVVDRALINNPNFSYEELENYLLKE